MTQKQRNHELALAVQAGDQKALADIVTENKGLIHRVIAKHYPSVPRDEMDDMLQEGAIGLIKAAQKYDPKRGAFSTIATWEIRGALSPRVGRYGSGPTLPKYEVEKRMKNSTLTSGLSVEIPETLPGSESFEEETARRIDTENALAAVYSKMTVKVRKAIQAGWLTGISQEDRETLLKELGVSRSTMTTRIREELKKIREVGI